MELSHLKQQKNWVYRTEKIPMDSHTGKTASTVNPSTWATFQQASEANGRYRGHGVGVVFSKTLGVVGIDLDHCVENGQVSPFAQFVLGLFPNTYRELSPSKTGIHILITGSIDKAIKKDGLIEIYDNGRYFTFTGNTPKNAHCEEIKPGGDNLAGLIAILSYKPAYEAMVANDKPLPTVGKGDNRQAWVNSLLERKTNELSVTLSGRNALICSIAHTMAGYSRYITHDVVYTAVYAACVKNGYLAHIGEGEFNRVFSLQWQSGLGKPLDMPTLSPSNRYNVGDRVIAKTKNSQIKGIVAGLKWSVEGYLYNLASVKNAWYNEKLLNGVS